MIPFRAGDGMQDLPGTTLPALIPSFLDSPESQASQFTRQRRRWVWAVAKVGEETSHPNLGQCDHGAGEYGFSSLAHLRGEVIGLGGTLRRLSGCKADGSPCLGTHVNSLSYWLPSFFIFYFCRRGLSEAGFPISPQQKAVLIGSPVLNQNIHSNLLTAVPKGYPALGMSPGISQKPQ